MTLSRTHRRTLSTLAAAFALTGGVAHALPAGSPDPGYGSNGSAYFKAESYAFDMLSQNEKVLMLELPVNGYFHLRRLRADGRLDRTFGGDGAVVFDSSFEPVSITNLPEGKTLLLGRGTAGTHLVRLTNDGAADPSFNAGGPDGPGRRILAGPDYPALAVRPDGDIVLARTIAGDIAPRELGAGGLDHSTLYSPGGVDGDEIVRAVAATGVGPVVAAERATGPVVVGRWAYSGKLDDGYGRSGFAHVEGMRTVRKLLPQPDDSVLVVGTSYGTDPVTLVAKLDPTGQPAAGYGDDGVATLDLPNDDNPLSVMQQADGKVIVTSVNPGLYAVSAGRLDTDGRPDETFGQDGVINVFDGPASGGAAALTSRGRLVVSAATLLSGGLVVNVASGFLTEATPDPVPTQSPTPEPTQSPTPQPTATATATATASATPAPTVTPVPTATPVRDTQAPLVSVIDVGRARRASVRLALTEPASVELAVSRGSRSVRTVKRLAPAGVTRVALGRLKRGRYRLVVTATDAAGNRAAPVTRRFRRS